MKNTVILGSQWGDEGKGKVIDFLGNNFAAVVRYHGGNNAGHTVKAGFKTVIARTLPAAIMHKDIQCYLGNGCLIHLGSLLDEISDLEKSGIEIYNRLFISGGASITLPSHVLLDQAAEVKKRRLKIGTTGKGIGPSCIDKISRSGLKISHLLNKKLFMDKGQDLLEFHNFLLTSYYSQEPINITQILEQVWSQGQKIVGKIVDVGEELERIQQQDQHILFEGAHGALLDIDFGTYPYVTSTNTTSGGVFTGSGISPKFVQNTIGIMKAYTTRVGEGPMPTELHDAAGAYLAKTGSEFGSVTGRARRCGWLDIPMMRYSCRLNGFDSLALTKLDVLDGLEEIKVCTGYKHIEANSCDEIENEAGTNIEKIIERRVASSHLPGWGSYVPVYQTFEGWMQPTSEITTYDKLPKQAQHYIESIEEMLQTSISIVSTGPDRSQTITK